MKERYDVVFVVLTYKNTEDLKDFLKSTKTLDFTYRVVVVNSHFDEATEETLREIAESENCDFIDVPNCGYGAGNNRGMEWAAGHYLYDALIVCNPDTVIREFSKAALSPYLGRPVIVAPDVLCASGKRQNPAIVRDNRTADRLIYQGYKRDSKLRMYSGFALNKLRRLRFVRKKKKDGMLIYQAHGCFVIFTKEALDLLSPVYDENMFLFYEEMDLSFKAASVGVSTVFCDRIHIFHKEDGSMKLSNLNLYNEYKKSCIYCCEKWGINK